MLGCYRITLEQADQLQKKKKKKKKKRRTCTEKIGCDEREAEDIQLDSSSPCSRAKAEVSNEEKTSASFRGPVKETPNKKVGMMAQQSSPAQLKAIFERALLCILA